MEPVDDILELMAELRGYDIHICGKEFNSKDDRYWTVTDV